jgi:hypothetical protein
VVNCIKTIEIETDKDAVNHMISGTNVATVTPTIAEMTWPPTKFRGWARGFESRRKLRRKRRQRNR